jgi:SAM-dependent methyltransferase
MNGEAGSERGGFIRYLLAKRTVDDRALNPRVWDALRECLAQGIRGAPPAIIEAGCGIATMLDRIVERRLAARADWTGIDADAGLIAYARRTLPERLRRLGLAVRAEGDGFRLEGGGVDIGAELFIGDALGFRGRPGDLLLAHAFIDLMDLQTALPALFGLLRPGGLFAFTLAFDGGTLFEPPVSRDLDDRIQRRYHRTMDNRLIDGRPSGDSRTGRRLFAAIEHNGAEVIAAGASDWIVFPAGGSYPADEAFFLRFIVDGICSALAGDPEIGGGELADWRSIRHAEIDRGGLVYIAHQLDVAGRIGSASSRGSENP